MSISTSPTRKTDSPVSLEQRSSFDETIRVADRWYVLATSSRTDDRTRVLKHGDMPTNDRMVLTLRHFSECSYQEIGEILGLDEKTVKSRLFEARHRLRELLKDLR